MEKIERRVQASAFQASTIGADVDDAATAGGATQAIHEQRREEKRPQYVTAHLVLEAIFGDERLATTTTTTSAATLERGELLVLCPAMVHQYVQLGVLGFELVCTPPHRRERRHVQRQHVEAIPAVRDRRCDGPTYGLSGGHGATGQHDMRTRGSE